MKEKWIRVVGIGDDGASQLPEEMIAEIMDADLLVGGQRHLSFFPHFAKQTLEIKGSLTHLIARIKEEGEGRKVVVLASGDPNFFGIGSYLAKQFGPERVSITPYVSSLQLAFARCQESWSDASWVSLHGRAMHGLAQRVNASDKVLILTDPTNTPSAIAKYLMRYEMREYRAFVAENLGSKHERSGWYELAEMAEKTFSELNVVLLQRDPKTRPFRTHLGIDDAQFIQRKPDRGLITKREIRVLSLAELQLQPGGVLWDIGACTGSVSIEAILQTPDLRVYAIEKNEEDFANLQANQVKFRTDFVAVLGRAPALLDQFEDPDAVFIGGSGGELRELLQLCAARLRAGGRIVVNAVTIETLATAYETLRELQFAVSVSLVQTSRSKPILHLTRFEGMNPVYLITGSRVEERDDDNSE